MEIHFRVIAHFFPGRLGVIKVSKSQKQFFFKLHCPKKEQNIRQNLPRLKLDLRIYSGLLVYSVLFVGFSPFYQVGTETPHRY